MGLLARSGLLAVVFSTSLAAQQSGVGVIAGVVRDSAGEPIHNVEIFVAGRGASVRTDSTGAYRLADLRSGRAVLTYRHFGYAPMTVPAGVDAGKTVTVNVVLAELVQDLPGMLITDQMERARQQLRDFYHRKETMAGFFLTRADIEKRNPLNLSDMLRLMPGAVLVPHSVGGAATLRFARAAMPGRDCPPQYFVDGVMTYAMNIDDFDPSDIEGIEVYSGPSRVPPQFNDTRVGTAACGVVVVWTRVPGT